MPRFNVRKWQGWTSKWVRSGKTEILYKWNPTTKRYIIAKKRSLAPKTKPKFDFTRIDEYQGRKSYIINRRERISMFWDSDSGTYRIKSRSHLGKGKIRDTIGIRFTFFAAIGGYPKPGTTVPEFFYSTDLLMRAIFQENDNQKKAGIRPSEYGGHVPLSILQDTLNSILQTRDWQEEYTNPNEYTYYRGVSVYVYSRDKEGFVKRELRKFIDKSSVETRVHGEPYGKRGNPSPRRK